MNQFSFCLLNSKKNKSPSFSTRDLYFITDQPQLLNLPNRQSTHSYLSLPVHLPLCRGRFEMGRIYTFIGEVVVSVNPYREMDIYGKEAISAYRGRELYENPPHLYAVADAAYKAMKRRNKDT